MCKFCVACVNPGPGGNALLHTAAQRRRLASFTEGPHVELVEDRVKSGGVRAVGPSSSGGLVQACAILCFEDTDVVLWQSNAVARRPRQDPKPQL